MSAGSLLRVDWDFSSVPNDELVGCCVWEYARESDFIRQTLHKYRDWFVAGAPRTKESDILFASMDRIQSIGDVSNVIIRGCSFPVDAVWQSEDDATPNYRHPHADPITGSFPLAWQRLSPDERKCRARMAEYLNRLIPAPIERGEYYEAEDIGKFHRSRVQKLLDDYRQIQKQNLGKSEVQLIEEGKLRPYPEVPSSLYWESGREVTVLRINWSDYTNDELALYFRRWAKTHRPEHIPVPSGKGRKPGDRRANLTRLGVMRLLGQFTPSDLLGSNRQIAREVSQSKQFARKKWSDSTKWHDARREARRLFSRLFPFLSAHEVPLSWLRDGPKNWRGISQVAGKQNYI